MQDDELHIEDLDAGRARRHRLLPLVRRLWNAWHTPRSPRGHPLAARVAAAGLTIVLALTLVGLAGDGEPSLGGASIHGSGPVPIAAGDVAPTLTITGKASASAETRPWQLLTLPSSGGAFTWYAASPSDPATLYACTGLGDDTQATSATSQPTLAWRSRDAGAHWTSLPLPALPAAWCFIHVAQDAPSRITVLSGDQLYLSDDGGDSWSSIALPPFAHQSDPDYTFDSYEVLPTAHHLYVQLDYDYYPPATEPPAGPRSSNRQQLSAFARSDDEGHTWALEGQTLGRGFFRPFLLGNEDTLIATMFPPGETGSGSPVWLSRDAGMTWTPLASLRQAWTTNLVTSPVGPATAPIYAMIDEQIPSSLFRLQVQQLYPNSGNDAWTSLPPLPVKGASPSRMGLLDLVGEMPDGRLLALGVDPAKGVPVDATAIGGSAEAITSAVMAPWLWEWSPDQDRWHALVAVPPVPPPEAMCGALCWLWGLTYIAGGHGHAAGVYLTLHSWKTAAPLVDRIFLPASGTLP